MLTRTGPAVQRREIRVSGAVQGVGFRPFVHRVASELGLAGWVLNDAQGVVIQAQGPAHALETFETALRTGAPSLARVERLQAAELTSLIGDAGFRILPSRAGKVSTSIPPDTATCTPCLAELFDPADRRYRHAFINCTQCGPRYTLTRSLPYDRKSTSMAAFAQCPSCLAEYTDALHRRFHAEPNACAACGPTLALVDASGRALDADPISAALLLLRAGSIVAIKGLGGFHLACDARNPGAVARLRERKQREEKPFAVMAANLASAQRWVHASTDEQAWLGSPERPIVLLPLREGCAEKLPGVAPGLNRLGVMLPCTPVQYLLFHEAAGRPAGTQWLDQAQDLLLVMTSANPCGEPLAVDNAEALTRLTAIADALLLHDRDIVARCDDSVLRAAAPHPDPLPQAGEQLSSRRKCHPVLDTGPGSRTVEIGEGWIPAPVSGTGQRFAGMTYKGARPVLPRTAQFIRRARGYTPRPIKLPRAGPCVLATGAWLKNTICITRGDEAFLSPHIGDLDNAATCAALVEMVEHLCAVLDVKPQAVAHDLHPDFFSTRFALEYAAANGLPGNAIHAVQHHHAHIAAVAAEHGIDGPLLGLALDGVGLGINDVSDVSDAGGTAWGGELLLVDGASFRRLGHLAPLAMPGGDAAAREPWRMAAAALHRICRGAQIEARFSAQPGASVVAQMLARELRCPPTTSMGRWFDAAAALLRVREVSAFEGQAPMLLEALAAGDPACASESELGELVCVLPDGTLDPTPLIARLADWGDADARHGSALFHTAIADGLARWVIAAAESTRVRSVAFAGGCFLNALLTAQLIARLTPRGIHVFEARQAPPNDGGIALGQAWVAMCGMRQLDPALMSSRRKCHPVLDTGPGSTAAGKGWIPAYAGMTAALSQVQAPGQVDQGGRGD